MESGAGRQVIGGWVLAEQVGALQPIPAPPEAYGRDQKSSISPGACVNAEPLRGLGWPRGLVARAGWAGTV